ncbi:hypothetical protein ACO22_01705 [Paracoccidioides brasiliensis]|uniref:Uncharacterized protein n=1 Tax=Paracoccidioides brasiliensis TaxID=121759 RepID=A0A1D2JKV9_PARBR|nr:hypothetical protein ACO22_01705 [Paracoccidioides brasiliensis]
MADQSQPKAVKRKLHIPSKMNTIHVVILSRILAILSARSMDTKSNLWSSIDGPMNRIRVQTRSKINHPEEFKYRNATLQCRPTSKHFDLTKPSYDLFRGQNLRENCVQQSFAFDNINRRLLVAQLRDSTGDAGHFCISTARYLQKVYRPHTPE